MSVGKKEKKLTAVVGAVVGGFEGAGVGCIAQKQSISVNNEQLSEKCQVFIITKIFLPHL